MSSIDLDLKSPELEIPTPVKAPAEEAAPVLAHVPESTADSFDSVQVSTAVNPEFNTEQVETVVNPSFGTEDDAFADRNFSLEQAETMVNPNFGAETELAPGFDITSNEEVTTKLDLAKAYEEMGDFEGARELLQEVLKEGDASHKEKAQAILAKIGE